VARMTKSVNQKLEDMQTPPFKARVDFYMVYYAPADHSEIKRDLMSGPDSGPRRPEGRVR
jgi:hypothetical protein